MGVKYAAAVSSGTAALHLALLGLEVSKGDEVIVPSFVCTALLNAVNYTGATPVIADIEPQTLNIDPQDVAAKIKPTTKAIVVPHMFGLMADIENLSRFGVPLIEDCAQSAGADWDGRMAGSFGKMGIYSFYATKVMTCGEGGMVVSDDEEVIDRVRRTRAYDNENKYAVRCNYKMTDFQAAMGRRQLGNLDDFIARRRKIAATYRKAFGNTELSLPPTDAGHIYYRYNLNVGHAVNDWIAEMRIVQIACARPVFKPLHHYLEGYACPRAEDAYAQTVSIPIYPSLSDGSVDRIVKAVSRISKKLNT